MYAILNKSNKQYFCGFDNSGKVKLGSINEAKPYETSLLAKAQSQLLNMSGREFQIKPVLIK